MAAASRPPLAAQAEAVRKAERRMQLHIRYQNENAVPVCGGDQDFAAALAAAAATLAAVPAVEVLLADWVEGWNGFSEAEIRRRTDHVTFNRIMKTRAALRRLGGEGRG